MHTMNGRTLATQPSRQPKAARPAGRKRGRVRPPNAERVLYASAAMAPWGLAILLLAVSMPHLAAGFQAVTKCGPLAGWLLAVAIDSAQVFAKLQLTVAGRYDVRTPAKWTAAGIVAGTALMSMALNVMAFLAGTTDRAGAVLAWAAGVMIPLLILALSYTGSCFALAKMVKAAGRKVN